MTESHKVDHRDYTLDLLKAISIILVLIWHFQPLQVSSQTPSDPSIIFHIANRLLQHFYFQITLIAVPTFILVSFTLFYKKLFQGSVCLKNRLWRLFKLFLFWTAVQLLIYALYYALRFRSFSGIFDFPLRGILLGFQPSLPYIKDSVVYFLVVLIMLIPMAFLCEPLKEKTKVALFFATIILSLIHFEVSAFLKIPIPYWRLDNFIIYIPAAYFLTKYSKAFLQLKYYYLLGFILFGLHNMLLLKYWGISGEPYDRISIFLGTLALVSFVYSHPFSKENRWVCFLAKYSLGIFALHKYGMFFFSVCFKSRPTLIIAPGVQLELLPLAVAAAGIALTLLTVQLLGKTKLKGFVS